MVPRDDVVMRETGELPFPSGAWALVLLDGEPVILPTHTLQAWEEAAVWLDQHGIEEAPIFWGLPPEERATGRRVVRKRPPPVSGVMR